MCEAIYYGRNECQAHRPGSVNDLYERMIQAYIARDIVLGDELRQQWGAASEEIDSIIDLMFR